MQKIYTEEYFLSANEANAEQVMAVPILVSKLIDIATAHANSLHIGNPWMRDINGGWVLSRLSIEMTEYPRVNDNYRISTWVESWNRHFSSRCFAIETPEGRVLGYARSIWMVMDIVNHTNLGLGHLELSDDLVSDRECPIPKQAKHKELSPDANRQYYRFKYCDLDYYRHVNTVRYVVLLLNQFPLEMYEESHVSRLELSFLHEANYGMEVEVASELKVEPSGSRLAELTLTDTAEVGAKPLLFARLRFSSSGK